MFSMSVSMFGVWVADLAITLATACTVALMLFDRRDAARA